MENIPELYFLQIIKSFEDKVFLSSIIFVISNTTAKLVITLISKECSPEIYTENITFETRLQQQYHFKLVRCVA